MSLLRDARRWWFFTFAVLALGAWWTWVSRVPDPVADPILALWGRNGVEPGITGPGVMGFGAEDMITP